MTQSSDKNSDVPAISFSFLIFENAFQFVVILIGPILETDRDSLGKLISEISRRAKGPVIVNFYNVPAIDPAAFGRLGALRESIRDRGLPFRFCSLSPELQIQLVEGGVVDGTELASNLDQALLNLSFQPFRVPTKRSA